MRSDGAAGPDRPAILFYSLADADCAARIAQSCNRPLILQSAPYTGAGIGWFVAVSAALGRNWPDQDITVVLDCSDEAGSVLGALRRGVKHLRFEGDDITRHKLAAIAAEHGAEITGPAERVLDLAMVADVETALRNWFQAAPFTLKPECHGESGG